LFLQVASRKKGKNQVPTSYLLQDSPLSFFCPTSCSSQESEGFFTDKLHTRAFEVRKAKEAFESARAGLSQKRSEKRKTKEGGLSPQEGDV
jgi:hypothetical protein